MIVKLIPVIRDVYPDADIMLTERIQIFDPRVEEHYTLVIIGKGSIFTQIKVYAGLYQYLRKTEDGREVWSFTTDPIVAAGGIYEGKDQSDH